MNLDAPIARHQRHLRLAVAGRVKLHGEGFSWGGKIVKSQFYPHVGILDWGTYYEIVRR
ncbi:MAG: hypothetical protein IJK04_05355 [Kiritimatiellae bacterium]|nr:hypothetical protein [Kiritimatiellia bacterium]